MKQTKAHQTPIRMNAHTTLTLPANIAENMARSERRRLEFGQKVGRIGTYEWDLVTNASVWTREFEALYGLTTGQLKTEDRDAWLNCIHPDDRDWVMQAAAEAIDHGSEVDIEYRVVWPDQTVHYLANRSQIIRNAQGQAILMTGVNIDITERKLYENNLTYLSEASKALASSLDYETTLSTVAKLAVPQFADWCSVTIKTDDDIKTLAVAHVDPNKIKWAEQLRQKSRPHRHDKSGVARVLKTGKSEFYPHITEELLAANITNRQELEIIRKLKMTSVMIIPLLLHDKAIGTISFVAAESGRVYTEKDVTLAEEVASRMALAIENARLFAEAKQVDEVKTKLASIVESSDDAIISKSIDGFITSWNRGAQKLYGYTAEEIIGQPVSILMPPEKKSDFPRIMGILQKGKKIEHYETKRVTKDGRILDVSITVSPIKNAQGQIIGASKVARDITDRKKLEQRQKFLDKASTILNASIDYETTLKNLGNIIVPELADYCRIVVVDENKQIKEIAVNHKDRSKLHLMQQLYEAYKDNSTSGVGQIIASGQSEIISTMTPDVMQQSNDRVLKLVKQLNLQSYMGVPLKRGERVIGALTFSSSTLGHYYSKADLKFAEELARRAALAIENAELYAQSQSAVAVRDDFISVASHELKTPITSTKIFTQYLIRHAEQEGNQEVYDYLKKMDRQLNKLTDLVYNMLDISKMQGGQMELNNQIFDFDAIIKETADVLQSGTDKHTITVHGQTKQTLTGDEYRIAQVASNLISNAIKYSPKSHQIDIYLKQDKHMVTCGVQDHGIGIPAQHLNHIFERFYRVFDATDKTFPGLGIGLYISTEIIQRHNGRLWVDSQPGHGSTFYFSLPINQSRSANV